MPTIEDVLLMDGIEEQLVEYYSLDGWRKKIDVNDCDGMLIVTDDLMWPTPFPFRRESKGGGSEVQDRTNPYDINIWKWKNPGESLDKITLSPSLMKTVKGEEMFHGYVRKGSWVEI